MDNPSIHGMWSSRLMFILAATGSAVGLGNIWRFPYMVSDNGGGAFVLVYLFCILLVGLPILIAEVLIGRHGRLSPINSLRKVVSESGASRKWVGLGWMGIIAGVLILSFYGVVAGWTLHYAWLYLLQLFGGAPITDPGATFSALLASPSQLMLWQGVFMVLTLGVVGLGVEHGLERAVRFLMPALFILLLILVGYGISTGYVGQAAAFLFKPDFSEITGSVFLAAMGQAFFTLSLGMCTMMAYGAYLPREGVSITTSGLAIGITDTVVALLAGIAIFPVVLSFGLDPAGGGPGLIFTSLPLAFEAMPFGTLYGLLFFGLLAVAAWTSSISLLEPATAWLVERFGVGSRKRAAFLVGGLSWLLGLLSVLSFNHWSHVRIAGRDIMSFIEFISSDLMLPLGGMLIALFVGWAVKRSLLRKELPDLSEGVFNSWLWVLRILAPALVLLVLLYKLV
ncbi:MAG: sodium-dependent transporter [Pseudomonadota bacterium]|nr:sodium-dependent transporter [Pseudomonadota bacterium]